MIVDVYKLVKGEAERVAEVHSIRGTLAITDPGSKTAKFLTRFRCRTPQGDVVSYEDGEAWLAVLPANLRGSQMWAEMRPNGNGAVAALHEASVLAGADIPFDEKLHPRDRRGRFAKKAGLSGLIGDLDFDHPPSVTEGPKSKIFLDPYHRSIETAASPRFKPLPKPTSQEAAREKVPGQPEVTLAPTVEERIKGMEEGEEIRFPEGTLVTAGPGGDTHRVEVGGTPVRPEDVPGSPELKAKFDDYDRRWAEASRRLGLDVNHTEQEGFWDGEEESSIATTAEAEQRQIEAAAALIGKHFNQDAMAVFTYDDDGPGARFSVKIPKGTDRSKLAERIKEGMPEGQGASVQGDEAYFYASDWEQGDEWAHDLADALGSDEVTGQRGTFTLLSDESYGDRTYKDAIEAAPEANALDQEWADEEGRSPDARPEGSGGSEAPARALGPLDQTFRIDGPDGTFWRVDRRDVDEIVEFEETTARANRYGAQIPGNPMTPMKGVDVKSEDPVGDAVGGTYHGGYSILPRGTIIHRKPGDAGDTFEVTSPLGTRVEIPATDKPAIIAAAKEMEKKAEGRLGGDAKAPENFKPTTEAADPDGPLQPLPEGFRDTRVAMHAESERVLGYEHGGNEVALIRTEGGFGTPWYEDDDGKQTRWRVDGTDIVVEKQDENGEPHETVRAPIGPTVTPENAKALADFFQLADKMQREARENGKRPDGEVTDRRFDAPIIWPEHLDMAIELAAPVKSDPNSRVTVGASPGDEGHPEPYFYVAPWDFKGGRSKKWNAVGFNGAQLDYADVLASDDQERTIREFYERYMKAVGAWLSKSDSTLSKPKAITPTHEASIFAVGFDEKLHPRDRRGRFAEKAGLPSVGLSLDDAFVGQRVQMTGPLDALDQLSPGADGGTGTIVKVIREPAHAKVIENPRGGRSRGGKLLPDGQTFGVRVQWRDVKDVDWGFPTLEDPAKLKVVKDVNAIRPTEISETQKQALYRYQDGGYERINAYLRSSSLSPNPEVLSDIASLDGAIKSQPLLDHDVTLYRGANGEHFADVKAGDVLTDKGFMSASTRRQAAEGFEHGIDTLLIIETPKGAKVMNANGVRNIYSGEEEILFPRGSRFVVDSVADTSVGRHIRMHMEPPVA
jgi:hypothetical protein